MACRGAGERHGVDSGFPMPMGVRVPLHTRIVDGEAAQVDVASVPGAVEVPRRKDALVSCARIRGRLRRLLQTTTERVLDARVSPVVMETQLVALPKETQVQPKLVLLHRFGA